jgi:hypothetical protein
MGFYMKKKMDMDIFKNESIFVKVKKISRRFFFKIGVGEKKLKI